MIFWVVRVKVIHGEYLLGHLYAIFAKYLEICKSFSGNLVNETGNIRRRGVIPKFSDLEVIALSLTAETMSIDSENYLFMQLAPYKSSFPNMISRRQFNDRRKFTGNLCETIRKRIADNVDGGEDVISNFAPPAFRKVEQPIIRKVEQPK